MINYDIDTYNSLTKRDEIFIHKMLESFSASRVLDMLKDELNETIQNKLFIKAHKLNLMIEYMEDIHPLSIKNK